MREGVFISDFKNLVKAIQEFEGVTRKASIDTVTSL